MDLCWKMHCTVFQGICAVSVFSLFEMFCTWHHMPLGWKHSQSVNAYQNSVGDSVMFNCVYVCVLWGGGVWGSHFACPELKCAKSQLHHRSFLCVL